MSSRNLKKTKILIVNWGTPTAEYVFGECKKLGDEYELFLAATDKTPIGIRKFFDSKHFIETDPYEAWIMARDVEDFMKKNQVNFDIVTTFFEMSVLETAQLAEYLRVPKRLPLSAALRTSVDKYLMRKAVEDYGLNQPDFFKFEYKTIDTAWRKMRKFSEGGVIKPVHSGHSYGVRYVEKGVALAKFKEIFEDALRDYERNYDEWMGFVDREKMEYLLEEYIGGNVYSFDGVIDGKKITFIGNTEFESSEKPILQQVAHVSPICNLSKNDLRKGRSYVEKIVRAIGLEYCGFHCEIKFKSGQPMLVEISGRVPGAVVLNAYQNLNHSDIFKTFFSVFGIESDNKDKKETVWKGEALRLVYSQERCGRVVGVVNGLNKEGGLTGYWSRSRNNGDLIEVSDNPIGTWLYEIKVRSKVGSKHALEELNKLIEKQTIRIESKWLDRMWFNLVTTKRKLLKKHV